MEDRFVNAFPDLLGLIERGTFHALPEEVERLTEKPSLLLLLHPSQKPPVLAWRSPGFSRALPERIGPETLRNAFPAGAFTLLPITYRNILLGWWIAEGVPHPQLHTLLPHLAAAWRLHLDELLDMKIQHLSEALRERVSRIRRDALAAEEILGQPFLREVEELFPDTHVFFLRSEGPESLVVATPERAWNESIPRQWELPSAPLHVRAGDLHAALPPFLQETLRINGSHSWYILPLLHEPAPEALVFAFSEPPHPLTLSALNKLYVSLSWARTAVQEIQRLVTHEAQLERFVGLARSFQTIKHLESFLVHLLDLFTELCDTVTGAALQLSSDGRELEVVAARGAWSDLRGKRFHRHQGLAGHALNQGRIVISGDYEGDPRLGSSPYVQGFRWGMGIPLILPSGKPIGVVVLASTRLMRCLDDLDFLETLTHVAMQFYDRIQKDRELLNSYRDTLNLLMRTLAIREHGTHEHTARVTALALALGKKLDLSDEELLTLYWGAMLHDIGKIGIPDHILRKDGPLTEEEWAVMRKHPIHGREILQDLHFLRGALDVVYHHHERFDGKGYPEGLQGHNIPYLARIFSVVDAFDAMISDRPYRKGMSVEEALRELARNRGTQFDPDIVDAFIQLIQERPELVDNPRSVFEGLSSIFHLYQLFMRR